MNATTKPQKSGLDLLREPFPANMISKLPKPTKKQTEDVRNDFKKGIRCKLCGQWHHPEVVHLDYVGHAALTDRLLDCDPHWSWEPVAFSQAGTPLVDENGGMWIRLTVCGVTRLGYGHPDGKRGGDAIKETIGDAMRNAAMRFGAALDLWHKGDLHADDQGDAVVSSVAGTKAPDPKAEFEAAVAQAIRGIEGERDLESLGQYWTDLTHRNKAVAADSRVITAKDKRKIALAPNEAADLGGEKIPY